MTGPMTSSFGLSARSALPASPLDRSAIALANVAFNVIYYPSLHSIVLMIRSEAVCNRASAR